MAAKQRKDSVMYTIYLSLQLKDIVNFLKWILERKSWLTLYYPSNTGFLPSWQSNTSINKSYNKVLNFALLIFAKAFFPWSLKIAKTNKSRQNK